jgi:diguanylate cyclase (GGDEF)-like protein
MAERLKQSQEALADMAIRDALTGCFNRREFHRRLQEEMAVSRRYGRSLSLLMLDLDHFKVVNDTYGHQVGDEVLKAVAGMVRLQLRAVDMVARFGGEEFTVILPETAVAGGVAVAERIRSHVENSRVTLETGEAVQITVSIGVVAFPLSGTAPSSEERLIAEADRALYIAKNKGRNRVWTSQTDNIA